MRGWPAASLFLAFDWLATSLSVLAFCCCLFVAVGAPLLVLCGSAGAALLNLLLPEDGRNEETLIVLLDQVAFVMDWDATTCTTPKRKNGYPYRRPEDDDDMVDEADSAAFDCHLLQRSLKRVRLSSSPGELRLDGDLRHLVSQGWSFVYEDVWELHANGGAAYFHCHLQRRTTTSLLLSIHNTKKTTHKVWMNIPKRYPHQAPVITRIEHDEESATSSSSNHAETAPLSDATSTNTTHLRFDTDVGENDASTTGIIAQLGLVTLPWSPIQRLDDALQAVVQALLLDNNTVGTRNASERTVPSAESDNKTVTNRLDAAEADKATEQPWFMSAPRIDREGSSRPPPSFAAAATTTAATFLMQTLDPDRHNLGYERESPWFTMDTTK